MHLDICITRIPKIPSELIETFINLTSWYLDDNSCIRLWYFPYFLLVLLSILVSKPTVSSMIYRVLSAVERSISGRNCSPVIIQGERNSGRSTKREASLISFKVEAVK